MDYANDDYRLENVMQMYYRGELNRKLVNGKPNLAGILCKRVDQLCSERNKLQAEMDQYRHKAKARERSVRLRLKKRKQVRETRPAS